MSNIIVPVEKPCCGNCPFRVEINSETVVECHYGPESIAAAAMPQVKSVVKAGESPIDFGLKLWWKQIGRTTVCGRHPDFGDLEQYRAKGCR
jgi:hypothetical protein